jgi:hypothetical protein
LIPGAFVGGLIGLAALAPFWDVALWLLVVSLGFYALATITATLFACRARDRFKFIPILPAVFAIYHVSYGYGFLRGIVDFTLLRRGARESFEKITRVQE